MIEDMFDGGHRRVSRQVEALGWKDLAVPAAGLALMAPFANPPSAQAAPSAKAPIHRVAPKKKVAPKPKPVTAQQAWAQMSAAAAYIAGRPVELRRETPEFIRDNVGWANAYVVLDGTTTVHVGPTIAGYMDYPNSGTFSMGVAELIHEATHLKLFFEDGGPQAAPNSYTRAADESVTNRAAIAMAPDIFKRFFPWVNPTAVQYGINRGLLELTPPQYH
jgi:hypothetical protein